MAILVEELENTSQNPELRKAAEPMRQALKTFARASQNSGLMPASAREALYELLTK